jgi:energy-coupling factor transport system permease protein
VAVLRAVATSALDRAVDVAATLEVRGYASPSARNRPRRAHEPWSRHDISVAASAAGLLLLAAGARLLGVASFEAYPRTLAPVGAGEWVLCAALVLVALAPFADRRGIVR